MQVFRFSDKRLRNGSYFTLNFVLLPGILPGTIQKTVNVLGGCPQLRRTWSRSVLLRKLLSLFGAMFDVRVIAKTGNQPFSFN